MTEPSETDEIEVTPKMIEAGALAMSVHNPFFESDEEILTAIYVAMVKASTS